jgi:chromosome segregation ATPase
LEREGESPEGYTLELEKLSRTLRRELDRMDALYAELDAAKRAGVDLQEHIRGLDARIQGLDEERQAFDARCAEAVREAEQGFRSEKEALWEAHSAERRSRDAETEAERARHREEVASLREELARKQAELDHFSAAYDELADEASLLRAQVLGQRARAMGVTPAELESMTEEESFNELERELEAFTKLYGRVWRRTKRKIRRDLLNPKYIKGQSGKK